MLTPDAPATTPALPDLVAFVRRCRFVVEATRSACGDPQAAVIGVVCDDGLDLFFDTLGDTRKARHLRHDPRVAVVAWEGARTLQLEGSADEPTGDVLATWKARYFESFPEGRERQAWPGLAYFRIRPRWARWSDFSVNPPLVVERTLGGGGWDAA